MDTQRRGYVVDASYPVTYFRELSPVWLNYVAALGGAAPRPLDRPFAYLELGAGFGRSTLVHAAALPNGEFHAVDLNPAYVEAGAAAASELGVANFRFHTADFEAVAALDLPPFDFIALHGVYTWVGAAERAAIRAVIRARLAPGGIVYVGYNCMPGWAAEVPLRRLIVELASDAAGDSARRTAHAVRELARLRGGELRYFASHAAAHAAVDAYLRSEGGYLAHELLNEAWEPLYSIDVADELAAAELAFVGSATLADNHDALVVGASAAVEIAKLATARQRRLAVDFAVDRRFRRDVFVRGAATGEPGSAARQLSDVVLGCLDDPLALEAALRVPRGRLALQESFVRELRPLFARGSAPLGEIAAALDRAGRDRAEIVRNLLYMTAAGALTPFAAAMTVERAAPRSFADAVTARVLRRVAAGEEWPVPSVVVGGGVDVSAGEARAALAAVEQAQAGARADAPSDVERLVRLGLLV